MSLTGVVIAIGTRFARSHLGELADFMQDGWVGAVEAVDAFDPSEGVKLPTFAKHRIEGAMLDGMRRRDHLTRHHRDLVRAGEVLALEPPVSIDAEDSNGITIADTLIDLAAIHLDEGIEVRLDICDALDRLPEREAYVLRQHYFAGRSMSELSAELGVTLSRVSQLAKKGRIRLSEGLYSLA